MQHIGAPTGRRRDAIVRQFGWLVHHLAWRLARHLPAPLSVADLESAGIIGLLDAADRYEATAGGSFVAYARVRVRGAMVDELRQLDWLPRAARHGLCRLARTDAALRQRLGRTPTRCELADAMDVSAARVDALQVLAATRTGDCARDDGRDLDTVPDPAAIDPEAAVAGRDWLRWALGQLDERERLIIRQSFLEGMRLRQIGAGLGLTESRVSQLRRQAMQHLRLLAARMGEAPAPG